MHFHSVAIAAVLVRYTAAKICTNITVPVSIAARTGIFNIAVPQTDLQVTDFVVNITQQGQNFTEVALVDYKTTTGTYNISAQFCQPSNDNSKNPVVQILTHGVGFDKTYWDLPYNDYEYSYIDVATDQFKFSTLSYDRLGIGDSSHGDPLNEIQSFLEIDVLRNLTSMLRSGTYPGVQHAFKKVVHVGHSFGSAQTYALANMDPTAADGIILTGFSLNGSFAVDFLAGANFVQANLNQPWRFGDPNYSRLENTLVGSSKSNAERIGLTDLAIFPKGQDLPNGYIISSDIQANKYLFLKPSSYDDGILDLAERTKQPVTLGEILTLGSLSPVNNYAGPVMVITGDSDVPYCGGNCLATGDPALPSIPAAVARSFPNVSPDNFLAYIQPHTGHGINLHYNATGAYKAIQNFLISKGLVTS